jgi:POT family proton-dependent oligopeptide transporter
MWLLWRNGQSDDFKWGFLLAAVVILLTIVIFETQKSKYLLSPDGKQLGVLPDARQQALSAEQAKSASAGEQSSRKWRNLGILAALALVFGTLFYLWLGNDWVSVGIFTACLVFPISILLDSSLTKIERERIFVIYIIAFFVIFFWAAYEQAGASLTLFAAEQTDRVIWGWEMPASWIQSFNPLFVVLLAYIMPAFWAFLNKQNREPSSPAKQAIGLLLLSLGYLFICFGVKDVQAGTKINLMWLTGLYFIHTMGRNSLVAHWPFDGQQIDTFAFCFIDDGLMVPFYGNGQ